jgi:hypothetical protein
MIKILTTLTLCLSFISLRTQANTAEFFIEQSYLEAKDYFLSTTPTDEQKESFQTLFDRPALRIVAINALWDMAVKNEIKKSQLIKRLKDLETKRSLLNLPAQLYLHLLWEKYAGVKDPSAEELIAESLAAAQSKRVSKKTVYLSLAFMNDLSPNWRWYFAALKSNYPRESRLFTKLAYEDPDPPDDYVVRDLIDSRTRVDLYEQGKYANQPTIFIFCRFEREQPCLMIVRDKNHELVRRSDGSIWHQPALTLSAVGRPSYLRNGNTPAGVHEINSVMPYANNQTAFGKWRRLILHFIPDTKYEKYHLMILPQSSFRQNWWLPATIARDVGRDLLRIHGTGRIMEDPTTPYYPLTPTHGCVSQRENTYDGIEYRDQRSLLDTLMVASDLSPVFENEEKIYGLLYLVDLDHKAEAVSLKDLALRGIE